jgi:hypothetical protein
MSTATIAPTPPPAIVPAAPPRPSSVRWTLARVEGRRLLAHPFFLLGMATSVVAVALASGRLPIGASDSSDTTSMLAGDCFVMLGGAIWTFLVAFLAASRERRDSAHDFYSAQPVTPRLRTQAALLSLAWAGLAGAGLIATATLVLVGLDGALVTDVNLNGPLVAQDQRFSVSALELLQGPLYLVTAAAFGVLLGSWTGHVYAAFFVALMLFLPPVALLPWFVFDDGMSRGFYGAVLNGASSGRILSGLAGLTALAVAGALARHDRRARVTLLAAVGLGVAAIALGLPPGAEPPPGTGP